MQCILTILYINVYSVHDYFLMLSMDSIGLFICNIVGNAMDCANAFYNIDSTSSDSIHVYQSPQRFPKLVDYCTSMLFMHLPLSIQQKFNGDTCIKCKSVRTFKICWQMTLFQMS